MKILVDFVAARQEYNPDTAEHTNAVVLAFAGREYVFAVTEEELVRCITTAKKQQDEVANRVREINAGADAELRGEVESGGAWAEGEVEEYVARGGEPSITGVSLLGIPAGAFTTVVDPVVTAPMTFQPMEAVVGAVQELFGDLDAPGPAELDPTEQRLTNIAARQRPHADSTVKRQLAGMKARAQQRPPRRINAVEGGYPDVPEAQVMTAPVQRAKPPEGTDEDGFGQA